MIFLAWQKKVRSPVRQHIHWTSCQPALQSRVNSVCCFGKGEYSLLSHCHGLSWLVYWHVCGWNGSICTWGKVSVPCHFAVLQLSCMAGVSCSPLPSGCLDKDISPLFNAWSPCSLYLGLWPYGLVVSHLEKCMSVMWQRRACGTSGVDNFHLTFFKVSNILSTTFDFLYSVGHKGGTFKSSFKRE